MKSVIECVQADCQPYVEMLKVCEKGRMLVRGSKSPIDSIRLYQKNLEERTPLNMPLPIHNQLNSIFEPEFGWKIRNGIFCFGFNVLDSTPANLGYGDNYMLFPIGNFEFVYEKHIFDLFGYFSTNDLSIEDKINNLRFSSTDLCTAMVPSEDLFSNEISVKANSYYLINLNFVRDIVNYIWD